MKVGVDLVSLKHFEPKIKNNSFRAIVYSEQELALASIVSKTRALNFLAGRFAVKEAVLKALGCGLANNIELKDIETLLSESGTPKLNIYGSVKQMMETQNLTSCNASISHGGNLVIAFVIMQ